MYGLGEALSNAASQVVTIDSIPTLATTLANKQPLLGSTASVALAALTCSLIRAAVGQNLNLSDDAGTVLLRLAPNAATFLRAVSLPSLDCRRASCT